MGNGTLQDWISLSSPLFCSGLRVVIVDMSDKESVLQAVEEAMAQFGRIDILVNNAGN